MLIPASRFSTLPEGCPVLWDCADTYIIGKDGDGYRVDLGGKTVEASRLHVWLVSAPAVRAFAPALIVAVRFPEGRYNDTKYQPQPLRDVARDNYVLIGYILDSGAPCAYMPRHELVTGSTPEECLLNGLKAALDAAKDEQ